MPSVRSVLPALAVVVLAASEASAATPTWESSRLLVGRMHPLLVHFPVALLLVAGLLELWAAILGRTERSAAARTCLALGTLGAAVAAFSGWTWAEREPLSAMLEEQLFRHRWAGVGVAATAALAWAALAASQGGARTGSRRLGRLALAVCVGGVLFAGHEGGEMSRGAAYMDDAVEEFLAGDQPPAPEPPAVSDAGSEALDEPAAPPAFDFVGLVQPILGSRCTECHGAAKQKGGVRLDRPDEALFQDFDGETVIARGDPDGSTLVHVVSLPADDLDIMPAEGDPLTAEQIDTLRAWIAAGAPWPGG